MGAPVLINAGRGGLQNEADILGCLDDGTLGAVSLDVYAKEPLPADSPFWTHPKVVLTPHNAADTDPDEISKYVARQIERFEAGGALENVVDPARGTDRADTVAKTLACVPPSHRSRPSRSLPVPCAARGRGRGSRWCGWWRRRVAPAPRDRRTAAVRPSPWRAGSKWQTPCRVRTNPSSTMARISGSATASEAAVITVKQPRGPASPETINIERHRIDALQPFADRQFVPENVDHRRARIGAIALIALDIELALVAERAVEARPVHAGGGAEIVERGRGKAILAEQIERLAERDFRLIGARPAAALRRAGASASDSGAAFLFCTISQKIP